MLYKLPLQDSTTKGFIFFEEDGTAWYGENEVNLQSAEGLEVSSGYKIPRHIYITDLSNAFKLGLAAGESIQRMASKIEKLSEGDF